MPGRKKKTRVTGGEHKPKARIVTNEKFFEYYKMQKLVPEEEWDAFVTALQSPLPTTFRITKSSQHRFMIRSKVEDDFSPLFTGGVAPPSPLPWYPDRLAWKVDLPKREIRKFPGLKPFHNFLVMETKQGNLSRQEAVSMIPAFFLDVQTHHKVLDMCAAPGSKTVQLLEAVHGDSVDDSSEGFVVANDQNRDRAYLLVYQTKRLRSPSFIVTNHDGQHFPTVGDAASPGGCLRFDRVLADVPCSGDGTLRKNPEIWKRWDIKSGVSLHCVQLKIALRGAKLLEVGGRMVYSTCSFNPLENEAVVAEMLRQSKGALELVDTKDNLPDLARRPGLLTWRVMLKGGDWIDSHDQVPKGYSSYVPSLFPPSPEEAAEMHLERCARMVPHDQDTGGFFVATLQKTAKFSLVIKRGEITAELDDVVDNTKSNRQLNAERKAKLQAEAAEKIASEAPVPSSPDTEIGQKRKAEDQMDGEAAPAKKKTRKVKKERQAEPPFYAFDVEQYAEQVKTIGDFFGLSADFPWDQLLTRQTVMSSLFMVSAPVRAVFSLTDPLDPSRLHAVNAGVKVFTAIATDDADACKFRVVQEGAQLIAPHMTKQIAKISIDDLMIILSTDDPKGRIDLSALSEDGRAAIGAVENGSYLIKVLPMQSDGGAEAKPMFCAAWKGADVTLLYVEKNEKNSLHAELCGVDYNRDAGDDGDE